MNPQPLFDEIAQFVADSRELLKRGAMMELAGLDTRVRKLCDAVLELSQEERVHYAERLQFLLGELKELGSEMLEQRDMLAREIQGLQQHKKASVAYRIAEASDARKDDKE